MKQHWRWLGTPWWSTLTFLLGYLMTTGKFSKHPGWRTNFNCLSEYIFSKQISWNMLWFIFYFIQICTTNILSDEGLGKYNQNYNFQLFCTILFSLKIMENIKTISGFTVSYVWFQNSYSLRIKCCIKIIISGRVKL